MNLSGAPIGRNANMGGSMFHRSGFAPVMSSPVQKRRLGEDEQKWFTRAKAAVAAYDDLWTRTLLINDKTYREQLAAKYHPKPEDQNGALYRRNSVAYKVSEAESFTPVNYKIFEDTQQQDKVTKLEELNSDFRKDVEYGEKTYGLLQAPAIIEQTTTTAPPTEVPGWLIPAGIGLGALIIGALLFGGD